MRSEFEKNGYYVLRGVLSDEEVDRLSRPIRAAFVDGDYDTYQKESAYPAPGIHSMGPRVLEQHPDIADLSLAHPAIMAAVEELFGEQATLAQYWSIMRPPGAGVGKEAFVEGSGAHYDYKPWRCVGSYVKWMFAVIPFVDYTETAGPLAISPGSHLKTTVRPSDGRVHQVDAACVPPPGEHAMVDPKLKKGDVVLMDGFAWHEARPNTGNSDRFGLYMKFHAKSSPPACGPTIYPSAVHDHLRDEARHLVPYHRDDGRFAALRDGPVGGVDEAQLLIEDSEGCILLLGDGDANWRLPRYAAAEDESAGILDVCNVMGSVVRQADAELGLQLPWLSWLEDTSGVCPGTDTGPWRCRVYAHRLAVAAPALNANGSQDSQYRWMTADELGRSDAQGRLESGSQVRKWLHMWQAGEDEEGRPVTRSVGLPTTDVQFYSYNRTGDHRGTFRIGEFDQHGKPAALAAES